MDSNGHFPRETSTVPMHFETDAFGRVSAYTAGGSLLQQSELISENNSYLHRIDIDGTFFYTSDRGMFGAQTDVDAVVLYHNLPA